MERNSKMGFGRSENTAPSIKTIDLWGWLLASVACGALAFFVSLHLLWRELPGPLSVHLLFMIKSCIHALFPNFYSRETAYYEIAVLHWDETGELSAMRWRLAMAVMAALLPGLLFARSYLMPRDGLIFLRGPSRYRGAEALLRLKRKLRLSNLLSPGPRFAPGIGYPAARWAQHVLITAGTGSGKTTFIKPLADGIIKRNEQLLMFDPKGDATKAFGKPSIMAPWDARSIAWDIGKDMRNVGDMHRFAAVMIKDGPDPMWPNAARLVVVGYMRHLRKTRGSLWGWQELADMIDTPMIDLHKLMKSVYRPAARAVEKASVTTQGILINLSAYCSQLYILADAWGSLPESRRVSFVEWTLATPHRHRQIIFQGNAAYPELTKTYIEGMFGVICSLVASPSMDEDSSRMIWIIADEAAEMGNVPIRQLFSMGRDRGIRCVFACQDFAQLEQIHGAALIKSLISMTGTLVVGKIGLGDTADALAKTIGSREVERPNVSVSYGTENKKSFSVSFAREDIPLYKPSEFGSRLGIDLKRRGVWMAAIIDGDSYELFWPFVKFPKMRAAHLPADWTLAEAPPQTRSDPLIALPPSPQTATTLLHSAEGFRAADDMSEIDKILIGAGYGAPASAPKRPSGFRPKI
jgi:hypothetical protein